MPETFHNLLSQIKENIITDNKLNPEVADTIKNRVCFENGIEGQKQFIDGSIIDKDTWGKLFLRCLLAINRNDVLLSEDDRQKLRFLVMVNIIKGIKTQEIKFVQNEKVNRTSTLDKKFVFHFIMRCFFNEETDPMLSTSNIYPFDKFSSRFYQNAVKDVTKNMIHELNESINDPFLSFRIKKQYENFKERYKMNKCT